MTEIWGFIGGKLDEIDGRRSRSRSGIAGGVPVHDGRGRMKKADDSGRFLPLERNNKEKPAFGHEKTPETPVFREFWLEVTPGFELPKARVTTS